MPCKRCSSANLETFATEVAIHRHPPADLDHGALFLYPEILVCLDCGFAEFVIPRDDLPAITA
jgi:hypothetical protein